MRLKNPRRLWAAFFMLLVLGWGVEVLAGQANIFVYHRFGDARYPSTNVALEVFRQQLDYLKSNDYRVLALGELVSRLERGEPLPQRCVVLTIDDGYSSVLTGALPLLKEFGYPATLFVATASVGHSGYLTWEQIGDLQREGIEIGNHSSRHDHLVNRLEGEGGDAWRQRIRADLVGAQEAFRKNLGEAPALFAYPYGEYDLELIALVRRLGFTGAAVQTSGVVAVGSDPFRLPRFPMGGAYATLEGFREKARMKPMPVVAAEPRSPLLQEENPPWLTLRLDPGGGADLSRLNCFVGGRADAEIIVDPEQPGLVRVRAAEPLSGRRSKYTLTAPAKRGGGWFWYSHLWIRPEVPE